MAKLKINSTYNLGNGVSYTISAAHRRKSLHIPEHTRSLSGSLLGYKTIP